MVQQLPTKDLLDLDQLNTLEETAYNEGFSDGETHGKLHGLFEGRDLGTLKGFEVWEEIGYMQGVASFWLQLVSRTSANSRKQAKQRQQLQSLLEMITTLPMENGEDVNLFGMIEKIRAKYRLACFSLGISAAKIDQGDEVNRGRDDEHTTSESTNRIIKVNGRSVDSSKLDF